MSSASFRRGPSVETSWTAELPNHATFSEAEARATALEREHPHPYHTVASLTKGRACVPVEGCRLVSREPSAGHYADVSLFDRVAAPGAR